MSNTFQLVQYKKSDRKEVFTFLREAYSSIECDRLIHQWDWKYDSNPFNRHAEPYILLRKDGAKIIGMLGAISLRVLIGGQEHWATIGCDLVIHPDYRHRGLSRRMVRQIIADHPLGFAWQTPIAQGITTRLISSHSVRLRPLVKALDFGQILQWLTGSRLLGRWGSLLTASTQQFARLLRRQPALAGVTINEVSTFDQRFDALWQRACRDYPVMVVRDKPYLTWRFACRPDVNYTLLVAERGPDIIGYLVLRRAERAGIQYGLLVDFLVEGKSSSLLAMLVKEAVVRLRLERVAAISCLATILSYQRTLYRLGFYPLFWGPPTYLTMRADLPDPTLQIFKDGRQWFLTMGDGDLDMAF